MSVQIFVMTHKAFEPPKDSMYQPLHVGHVNAPDLGFMGDDTGVHISERNCYYAELSGMYWVYQNCHSADYVGICHYRRYLINDAGRLFTQNEIEQILSHYDLMTTKTLELRSNYYDGFSENHNLADLKVVEKILQEKFPADYQVYEKYVHENHTYFGNICVMPKDLYDEYCSWLFDVFFEAEKFLDLEQYDKYQMRFFGFVSEFLLYVFVKSRKLKPFECKVGMIGEKAETKECKEKLAEYFLSGDIEGAQAYFLECRRLRPDILMEASDVSGELRQCMQVIVTAKAEKEMYGNSFLDSCLDFQEIMQYIATLNKVVNRILHRTDTKKDHEYIKMANITSLAWEISVTIYVTNKEEKERVLKVIEDTRRNLDEY